MKKVTLYCDGACSGNPGPGGWAAVLDYKGKRREICGFVEDTTNNRMELTAALRGLLALKESCDVNVYTDSAYIHNAFSKGWIIAWQYNNWRKTDRKPVENQDLWKELLNVCKNHSVKWFKVKGHADDVLNNRCDELARNCIKQNQLNSKNEGNKFT